MVDTYFVFNNKNVSILIMLAVTESGNCVEIPELRRLF